VKDFSNATVLIVSGALFCAFENVYMPVHHITSIAKIFPALYQYKPGTIVIDYEFLNSEAEKVIRRIRTNPYHKKLKICCLKSSVNNKTDSLLMAIGVDHLIYKNDFISRNGNAYAAV
jgi:hypothetical protein